jgi:hypothetical protein
LGAGVEGDVQDLGVEAGPQAPVPRRRTAGHEPAVANDLVRADPSVLELAGRLRQ